MSSLSRLPGLLEHAQTDLTSDVVHKLRTTIRRAEVFLLLRQSEQTTRVLKQLKRIRRRAGRVRDIDVQLDLLGELHRSQHQDVVAVTAVLQEKRQAQERKLEKIIAQELDSKLLRRLQEISSARVTPGRNMSAEPATIVNEFVVSLNSQDLKVETLHSFRTITKKLKYRAELAPPSELRDNLITQLKKVQDAIGAWHDSLTLAESAAEIVGSSRRNSLISSLRGYNESRYLEALRVIEAARTAIPALILPAPSKRPVGAVGSVAQRQAKSA